MTALVRRGVKRTLSGLPLIRGSCAHPETEKAETEQMAEFVPAFERAEVARVKRVH